MKVSLNFTCKNCKCHAWWLHYKKKGMSCCGKPKTICSQLGFNVNINRRDTMLELVDINRLKHIKGISIHGTPPVIDLNRKLSKEEFDYLLEKAINIRLSGKTT